MKDSANRFFFVKTQWFPGIFIFQQNLNKSGEIHELREKPQQIHFARGNTINYTGKIELRGFPAKMAFVRLRIRASKTRCGLRNEQLKGIKALKGPKKFRSFDVNLQSFGRFWIYTFGYWSLVFVVKILGVFEPKTSNLSAKVLKRGIFIAWEPYHTVEIEESER